MLANPATANAIRSLRKEMFANLAENWTIARMSEAVGLSTSHFQRVYTALFGISPTQDLIQKRINMAKYYLGCQDCSVRETALRLGYENEFYFIRLFKKHTGISPGKYSHFRQNKDVSNRND